MDDQDFDAFAQKLGALPSRRKVMRALGATAMLGMSGLAFWSTPVVQAGKHKKKHHPTCALMSSGSECSDGIQCCSGTCNHSTIYKPDVAKVCCQAVGEFCRSKSINPSCCGEAECIKSSHRKAVCVSSTTCQGKGSGVECSDANECCSGSCDHNTAYNELAKVCCRSQGESCRFGFNECCGDLGCDDGICGGGGGTCSAGSGAHGEVIDCG
jgi:hypothetical protein